MIMLGDTSMTLAGALAAFWRSVAIRVSPSPDRWTTRT
jgi:hypothetical protein